MSFIKLLWRKTFHKYYSKSVVRVLLQRALRKILPEFVHGDFVVDIGGGTGWVKSYLCSTTNYANIDIVKKDGVTLVGEASALPIKEEAVDAVFCISLLEHIQDYRSVIEEISRVLKTMVSWYCLFLFLSCSRCFWMVFA